MKSGTPFEELAAHLFGALSVVDLNRTIEVHRNIILPGKITAHEIDVYWRLQIGNIFYETIIQAKDWSKPVDQGEVLKFKGVMDDLPNQPRAIMVSRLGYQSGAVNVAAANGILLFTIDDLFNSERSPLRLSTCSIAKLNLEHIEVPILRNSSDGIEISLRKEWHLTHRIFTPREVIFEFQISPPNNSVRFHEMRFVSDLSTLTIVESNGNYRYLSSFIQDGMEYAVAHSLTEWSDSITFSAPVRLDKRIGKTLIIGIETMKIAFSIVISTGESPLALPELKDYFVNNALSGEISLVRVALDQKSES